jgi:hypothetical protein
MAVPKKKMSKSRKNARKNTWKKKILKVSLAIRNPLIVEEFLVTEEISKLEVAVPSVQED